MRVMCYIFGFCPTKRKWLRIEFSKNEGREGEREEGRNEEKKERRRRKEGRKEGLPLPKLLGDLV